MPMYYRRLRDLREDHDMTQDELVAKLGMHKTTYTNYEQGKREIPFALVIRLAKLYNVSTTSPSSPIRRSPFLATIFTASKQPPDPRKVKRLLLFG